MANRRMKVFQDVTVLGRGFDVDNELLTRTIRATFDPRNTPLPVTWPCRVATGLDVTGCVGTPDLAPIVRPNPAGRAVLAFAKSNGADRREAEGGFLEIG